ncbi:unnamed protein product [Amoebophrya sp. A120]|nr:unnamed protein product [Amoebophrya sp. A120]|eukprot:GSA120T00014590001.1
MSRVLSAFDPAQNLFDGFFHNTSKLQVAPSSSSSANFVARRAAPLPRNTTTGTCAQPPCLLNHSDPTLGGTTANPAPATIRRSQATSFLFQPNHEVQNARHQNYSSFSSSGGATGRSAGARHPSSSSSSTSTSSSSSASTILAPPATHFTQHHSPLLHNKHKADPKTSFIMRFYSHIDKAASTSTYSEGDVDDTFSAEKALALGSGYWCSSGKHGFNDVVSYAGELKHRKKLSGVKIFWAYAPGKVQIRTSPDGVHWSTIIPFHASPRSEVTYEQNLLFDKQRNVKKISVDMTNPRPWGFFGINQISLLR